MNHDEFDIIIEPERSMGNLWKDLRQYRDLFYFLAWRDILVRYKQTVVGVAWSLIRPLMTMVVFTVVFGRLAGLPSDGNAPYSVMVFCAMTPWQLFSTTVAKAGNSLISNASLISKVYFPRVIIPTVAVITGLVDFAISFVMLILLMLIYGMVPTWKIVLLPLFLSIVVLSSLGAGLFISAMNVKYRDFMHVVPFLIQFMLYISPVGYSSGIVPESWQFLYALNPMVGVIDGFRWMLLGEDIVCYWPGVVCSVVLSCLVFRVGLTVFTANERTFADYI